jgi:PPM family protein phosphatase
MTENNFQINSAAISDRGLSEKRPQNEDSFLEMNKLGLFAVADGVGGAQAGDVASQMAVEILGEAFVNLKANGDAEEMMKIAIERANSAIYQMSTDLPQLSTMATTIVTLHLSGNIATIGHVGDSRLYRLDGKGSLYRETQDHSVVEEEVRAGRMTAAQAANHPSRNVISRALGAESTVEVDMKTIMFEPNTSFLLCSDGITRHINDFEIRDLLLTIKNPADTCQKMKDICYSRGAEDNLTAVIIKVIGEAEPSEFSRNAVIEDDEATVATPRQAVSEPMKTAPDDYDEIPTRALEMPASMQTPPDEILPQAEKFDDYKDEDETYLMDEPSPAIPETVSSPLPETSDLSFTADEPRETPVVVQRKTIEEERPFSNYSDTEKSGFFGKLLSSLLLLLIGAILGVAAYYSWLLFGAPKADVPTLTPQTNNIPKNSTDIIRHDVESKPLEVIKQYRATPPKDAADFYFYGRSLLLTKNYEEARNAFIEARNRLKDVTDAENKAVLATDITMGLTIAEDKAAQTSFDKEMKFSGGGELNSNTSVSGNSANANK